MSDEMRKIIGACYQHFSKFHVPSTLNLCDCAYFIFGDRENGKLRSAFASDYPELDLEINQWINDNAKVLSQNAQIAVLNMPDLAWQNKTKIDYLRDEYLLAMCDENVILATLP